MIRKSIWLAGASIFIMPTLAVAQDAATGVADGVPNQDIVVTGSRVITNGNNSPTPVTIVTTEQLAATTPSNVPDALNKLPVFANSRGAQTLGNAGANNVGNFLNLRGFGVIRTLILFDGRRVPATNADGTVDTNTLPQMLLQRVDVVTGGASAVYGSDAVTGVVNFVLDKKFTGLKTSLQAGISDRGDAFSWRGGLAYGTDLLGGRGHFMASYEHYDSDGIGDKRSRSNGGKFYSETGAGTAANPFHLVDNTRAAYASWGGLIQSGALAGNTFDTPTSYRPFVHGTATGTAAIERGGDGVTITPSALTASLKTDQAFGRFDYELSDTLSFFAQGSFARTQNANTFAPMTILSKTISASNPYLPQSARNIMAAGGTTSFTFSRFVDDVEPSITRATARNYNGSAGLSGKVGTFDWEASYTFGRSRQTVYNINNVNNGKLAAALDTVQSGGQIVCRVSVTNPGLYPGCVPLNPFGAGSITAEAADYVRDDTRFTLTNTTHDFNAFVSGSPFDTWAGPVKIALSGEYRKLKLENDSSAQPSNRVNCTGLVYNCVPVSATNNGTALYGGNVTANMSARQNISEVAFEVNIPLLRDAPLARSLDANGAVRYAHYSVSGNATTWKLGLDWHVTDDLSFRATRSRDIRAPTLFDLFSPRQESLTGFTDTHTNTAGIATIISSGNPDLQPEVANTLTLGGVYRASWLPGFSVSIDYFKIKIANAIASVGGNSAATLAQCEASGGTSPLCDLYVRPLPFSNTSAANYPTAILSRSLNVAQTKTEGVDADMNYRTSLGGGTLSLRGLLTYQPTLETVQFVGATPINAAGAAGQQNVVGQAKWRTSALVGYATDSFSIDVQERWRSSLKQNGNPLLVFSDPKVPAVAYTDLNLTFYPGKDKNKQFFISVQNLFDKKPPVFISPSFASNPGFYYPAVNGDDVVGRYFTIGVRGRF
ncbi:MAG: hypothetical protein A2095_02895 [Sphingomonadales bacterium GWF1_63_6]|nr:MAG: hypothetical protein A2095_02895 [Sphingomonadales bacterium GWF1_63_6]